MSSTRYGLVVAMLVAVGLQGRAGAEEGGIPRYLLVWQDAPLYTLPTEEAPNVHIFEWTPAQRSEHPGAVMWVELVGEAGEFYEVITRNTIYADGQCYGPVPDLWAYEIHLFVRRPDVALATTETVSVNHRDGTGATLKPGVALLPLASKRNRTRYLVAADGLHFEAEVPTSAVGEAFRPDHRPFQRTWLTETLAEDAPMWLGDGGEVERYKSWGMRRPTARAEHPKGALITLSGECGEYRVAVRADDLPHTSGSGALASLLGSLGDGSGSEIEVRIAHTDTPVYFADGRRAGQMAHDTVYYQGDLVAFDSGAQPLSCTSVLLGGGSDLLAPLDQRTLQLCFRSDDLTVEMRGGHGFVEDLFGHGELGDLDALLEGVSGVAVEGEAE